MTGRERHAALEASVDADRARSGLPGGGGSRSRHHSPGFIRDFVVLSVLPGSVVAVAVLFAAVWR